MADQTNFEDSGKITEEALNMTSEVNTDDIQSSPAITNDNLAPNLFDTPIPTVEPSNFPPSGPGTGIVNFDQPYPDITGYDIPTFEDAVDEAIETQGMPNLEMNQPFFDMIERAAVDLDKYPIMFSNNDMNAGYPGRAGTDFNPFRTNTGIPDLNTANGIKAFLSSAVDLTKAVKPNTTPGYKDPFYYSARRYDLDFQI